MSYLNILFGALIYNVCVLIFGILDCFSYQILSETHLVSGGKILMSVTNLSLSTLWNCEYYQVVFNKFAIHLIAISSFHVLIGHIG